MSRACFASLLLLVGCGAHASIENHASAKATTPATSVSAPPSAPAVDALVSADGGAATLDAQGYVGVVDRAGLVQIVEQGLGRMLARLKLSPVMDGKRFRGFRVTALDPQWSSSGIQDGDIITRLNGQPIERPEQAMVAFESLRVASEIALELEREGQKSVLRYRIE